MSPGPNGSRPAPGKPAKVSGRDLAPVEETLRTAFTTATLPWLIADLNNRIVGYAYANAHRARPAYRSSVDTSVYVAESFHRRGVGRALYTALIERLTALGYVNAFAGITLPNSASIALHESVGFTPVGLFPSVGFKLGTWHDVGWWGLRLRQPPAEPDEPLASLT